MSVAMSLWVGVYVRVHVHFQIYVHFHFHAHLLIFVDFPLITPLSTTAKNPQNRSNGDTVCKKNKTKTTLAWSETESTPIIIREL
jgi:hypothetical protein